MQKTRLFSAGLISVIVLTFGFLWMTLSDSSFAAFSTTNRPDAAPNIAAVPYNSSLIQTPSADLGSDELPTTNLTTGIDSASALPTPIPGETQVYFVPSDNDASATVLFLYNTDTVTHTVALRGFSYNGVLVYSLNINILPTSFLRLASDSIASAPPPSWATPAPVITNFTDFTYFASLSLPKGVTVEGYVIFNPGTGVADPRTDQGAIPLRFSTDPAALSVSKTASEGNPTSGDVLTFTVVVGNEGLGNANAAVVSDTIPAGLSFVSGSTALEPPGAGVIGDAPALATNLTIAAGQAVTVTYQTRVTSTSGQITNTVSITSAEITTPVTDTAQITVRGYQLFLPLVMK